MTSAIRLFLGTLLLGLARLGLVPGAADSLGVQACNTDCQTAFTDCIQHCDGAAPCQAECDKGVEACVKRCVSPPATPVPAPPGGSSGAPHNPSPAKPPATTPRTPPKGGTKP